MSFSVRAGLSCDTQAVLNSLSAHRNHNKGLFIKSVANSDDDLEKVFLAHTPIRIIFFASTAFNPETGFACAATASAINSGKLPSLAAHVIMKAGLSYIVLNILRACSIGALILCAIASIIFLAIEARYDFSYFFFSIIGHAALVCAAFILLVSEAPFQMTAKLLHEFLPVYSAGFSLAWTGLTQVVMACSLLHTLRSPFYILARGYISRPMRTLNFTAGVALGVISLIYLLMPFIYWRPGRAGGECRRLRKEGALVLAENGSESGSVNLKPYVMKTNPIISKPILMHDGRYEF